MDLGGRSHNAIPLPEYIDVCATCAYTAWREGYPCNRCGGLESVRYLPQPQGAVEVAADLWNLLTDKQKRELPTELFERIRALNDSGGR